MSKRLFVLCNLLSIFLLSCSTVSKHNGRLSIGESGKLESYTGESPLLKEFKKDYGAEWKFNRNPQNRKTPPKLGLAMSGGGVRSASFCIGVLRGLEESHVLDSVDIISSVSGGGYALLWYYSQYIHMKKAVEEGGVNPYGSEDVFRVCPPKEKGKQTSSTSAACDDDKYRFQHNLEEKSYIASRSPDALYKYSDLFMKGVLASMTFPAHVLGNFVFDWRWNVNLYRYFYQNGLERVYSYVPLKGDLKTYLNDRRVLFPRVNAEKISFGDVRDFLNEKAEDCSQEKFDDDKCEDMPFFVVNATSSYGNSDLFFRKLPFAKVKDSMEERIFEFTPLSYGSDSYGYDKDFPVSFSKAVTIAGAAVDSQAEQLKNWYTIPVIWMMDIANLNLGYDIDNYNLSWHESFLHNLLPFPLYMLSPNFKQDEDTVKIHLSDGGHSENLGLYSLIRRRVKNIIIVDAEYDPNSSFEALTKISHELKKEYGLRLEMCTPKYYDVFNVDNDNAKSNNKSVIRGIIKGFSELDGKEFSINLLYIKLSINEEKAMGECGKDGEYPCTVTHYDKLLREKSHKDKSMDRKFPHESTADISYSPDQFRAYRDLGYSAARSVVYRPRDEGKIKKADFKDEKLFELLKDKGIVIEGAKTVSFKAKSEKELIEVLKKENINKSEEKKAILSVWRRNLALYYINPKINAHLN